MNVTTPHHLTKLHDELLAAGLDPTARVASDDETVSVELIGLTKSEAQAVIDAHDPTPPPTPPDPDAELDAALAVIDTSTVTDTATRDVIDGVIAALRGKAGHEGAAAGRRPA